MTAVADEALLGKFVYDWQGRTRVLNLQPEQSADRRYMHHLGNSPWREMNAAWSGAAAPGGFSISPANYFGERSTPLGFGFDGNTIYFASNVGRDTFGHAVDSSATVIVPGCCVCVCTFNSRKNDNASKFSRPPKQFGSQSPASRL
jgi:hypothetical protein